MREKWGGRRGVGLAGRTVLSRGELFGEGEAAGRPLCAAGDNLGEHRRGLCGGLPVELGKVGEVDGVVVQREGLSAGISRRNCRAREGRRGVSNKCGGRRRRRGGRVQRRRGGRERRRRGGRAKGEGEGEERVCERARARGCRDKGERERERERTREEGSGRGTGREGEGKPRVKGAAPSQKGGGDSMVAGAVAAAAAHPPSCTPKS